MTKEGGKSHWMQIAGVVIAILSIIGGVYAMVAPAMKQIDELDAHLHEHMEQLEERIDYLEKNGCIRHDERIRALEKKLGIAKKK